MNKPRKSTLHLTVNKDRVPYFFPLLTKGFTVKTKVGCSVQDLLCRHLGLSADYMEHRLQTIFLDGKAVDDVKDAVAVQGATLALSAAMPGLAGATLRRCGTYAAMRHQITHTGHSKNPMVKDGTIVLKLFNLVAKDIGFLFLAQGVQVSGNDLQRLFQKAPKHLWEGCYSVQINGKDRNVSDLSHFEWKRQQVFFKLIIR
ncbi:MAG: hypothetical protein JSW04_10735 [Desulfobacterales bacterium]|nr:MAG: hypothetical protein JSV38_12610 [Desulfobacterales bacterium]UCD88920.1 MAG: hypothetical protein JSW04_10735 [Desulfobacterales bacterium]